MSNKYSIVTGASRGLGAAIAEELAREGYDVVITYGTQADKAQKVKKQLETKFGVRVESYQLDIKDEEAVLAFRKWAEETLGTNLQVLVNNAGISMRAMFKDLDLSVIHSLMDVNFWGTVQCTKFALPYLLQSKGQVVGVISIAGFSALPARTGYSASKYAIRGFLDTIRIEHLKDGLNVLVFAPGYTDSNVRKAALTADGSPQGETPLKEDKLMSAEKCAEYLAKGLEKRKSQMILTGLGKVTVLAHRLFPRLTDKLTYGFIAKEAGSPFK